HTHFDHIGTHHEFAHRAVHPAAAVILAHPTRANTYADYYVADDSIFTALPPGDWIALCYDIPAAPAHTPFTECDVVAPGDRSFEVIHLPGHSTGSIALYEKSRGILFAGDVSYDGELAYNADHAEHMRQYVNSMKRVLEIPVRVVHGGHYPSFGQDRLRELARAFLDQFDR